MDVTELRRTELALNKVRTELWHISRMTSMGELSASIAHEVNNPSPPSSIMPAPVSPC